MALMVSGNEMFSGCDQCADIVREGEDLLVWIRSDPDPKRSALLHERCLEAWAQEKLATRLSDQVRGGADPSSAEAACEVVAIRDWSIHVSVGMNEQVTASVFNYRASANPERLKGGA